MKLHLTNAASFGQTVYDNTAATPYQDGQAPVIAIADAFSNTVATDTTKSVTIKVTVTNMNTGISVRAFSFV